MQNLRIFIVVMLVTVGCTTMCGKKHHDMTAKEVVEAYLTKAFNINSVQEISDLIAFTAGNLKQALEEADAVTISKVFVERQYYVKDVAINNQKNLTPREVEITYELQYREIVADQLSDALLTVTNTLNLLKREGAWYITDVIGGETTIDFQIVTEITPRVSSSPSVQQQQSGEDVAVEPESNTTSIQE